MVFLSVNPVFLQMLKKALTAGIIERIAFIGKRFYYIAGIKKSAKGSLQKYLDKQATEIKERESKLEELFQAAIEILKEELKSSDPERRLKAATELLHLKNN